MKTKIGIKNIVEQGFKTRLKKRLVRVFWKSQKIVYIYLTNTNDILFNMY